ncbi:MAG: NfeD family protein [Scytolyngbya sp. HA4215-MV1]|jgi:hypothetical protein|nr:NfeD family protein [Scytolyngbya sp. HA4215-MV1]
MNLIVAPETFELFPQVEPGKVEQTITPQQPGRVRSMATSWPARFYDAAGQTIAVPNTPVQVVGRVGITLLVMPMGHAVRDLRS